MRTGLESSSETVTSEVDTKVTDIGTDVGTHLRTISYQSPLNQFSGVRGGHDVTFTIIRHSVDSVEQTSRHGVVAAVHKKGQKKCDT